MEVNEKNYSREEVARILSVHPMTVWREIQRGNLRAFRIGKRSLRVTESALNEYVKKHAFTRNKNEKPESNS